MKQDQYGNPERTDMPSEDEIRRAQQMQFIYGPPAMLNGQMKSDAPGMMMMQQMMQASVQEQKPAHLRAYTPDDLPEMLEIWNAVVTEGKAFPQEDVLSPAEGAEFFAQQTHCGVAELDGQICGLYILHPNKVGRCGHIANASYAVRAEFRGRQIGEQLVRNSIMQAKQHGFRILQYNAVVEGNAAARKLYEKLGFVQLGTIPGGFRMPDGGYVNICPYYKTLTE